MPRIIASRTEGRAARGPARFWLHFTGIGGQDCKVNC
jgi:hypothetical protein